MDEKLLNKMWDDNGIVRAESCIFFNDTKTRLLFKPAEILRVATFDNREIYVPGRDYEMTEDGLEWKAGGRCPYVSDEDMYFDPQSVKLYPDPDCVAIANGPDGKAIRFARGTWYMDHQVFVDYRPQANDFPKLARVDNGFRESFAERMKKKGKFVFTCIGDSIAAGYNSSAFCKVAPWQPGFPELVMDGLEEAYGITIDRRNHAISGTGIKGAWEIQDKWLGDKPDLLVIAYGMNNFSNMTAEAFVDELKKIIDAAHEARPDTLILTVSSMAGNSEWKNTPPVPAGEFAAAMQRFAEATPLIGYADVYSAWEFIRDRKGYYALTGNGVNHPNDYGFRVYADVILEQLLPC